MSETDCVVITGSHNFSQAASKTNDENLVIVKGNQPLAQAYLAHTVAVWHHVSQLLLSLALSMDFHTFAFCMQYRWRFAHNKNTGVWNGELAKDDSWQAPFFDTGNAKSHEL